MTLKAALLFVSIMISNTSSALAQDQVRYKSVDTDEHATSSVDPFKGSPPPQRQNLTLSVGTDYFAAFGVQGRYAYRILDRIIEEINNPIYIEGGAGMSFYGGVKRPFRSELTGVTGFNIALSGRWDFILDQMWTFFALAGFGHNWVSHDAAEFVRGANVNLLAGIGGFCNVTPEWAVRADIGYNFTGLGVMRRF
jgi:hypothetical protein